MTRLTKYTREKMVTLLLKHRFNGQGEELVARRPDRPDQFGLRPPSCRGGWPVIGPIIIPAKHPLPLEHRIEEPTWIAAKLGEAWNLCPVDKSDRRDADLVFNLKLARVRYALKKGLKGIDIQLRLGVSAGCVAEQRRRYNADLAARGKALLPPPGGGEAYSGVKLSRGKRAEVEALFMQGHGTARIAQRTGASKSSCGRIRDRLVRKLRRKGETLPGCDTQGIRRVYLDSTGHITAEQKDLFRAALLEGMPVRRAALRFAIGGSSAYQLRDDLVAELAARGEVLPRPVLPGKVARGSLAEAHWPPRGQREICAFRQMLRTLPFHQAKDQWRQARIEQRAAERTEQRTRQLTFEQQLARVAAGEVGLTAAFGRQHLEPRIGA